jgi:hypothetical protein
MVGYSGATWPMTRWRGAWPEPRVPACAAEYIAHAFRRLGLAPAARMAATSRRCPCRAWSTPTRPAAPAGTCWRSSRARTGAGRTSTWWSAPTSTTWAWAAWARWPAAPGPSTTARMTTPAVWPPCWGGRGAGGGAAAASPVVFMAFTGEESGLLGSAHWIRHPTLPLEGAVAMMNMDMVGRLAENGLVVYGTGTAEAGRRWWRRSWSGWGLEVQLRPRRLRRQRPDVVLHAGHPGPAPVHQHPLRLPPPVDDWDRIDEEGVRTIAGMVAALVRAWAAGSGWR